MKICVIGAGSAGLAAARQITDANYNFSCVVFEQSNEIGGTWVYSDETGLHTSMYKNLKTNLPKEIMCYPDFEIKGSDKSYVTQKVILDFLNDYAKEFNLMQFIKFRHRVKLVEPCELGWKIVVEDLSTYLENTYNFDVVMVCNGHYHTPSYPEIEGHNKFQGIQIHSHDFRDSQHFSGRTVLVIGAGPSGLDIAVQISYAAKMVILSHHSSELGQTKFPENVKPKPNVSSLKAKSALFVDNTEEDVDTIVYCTGYKYAFPFLSDSCGITVDDNYVKPLYKHLININYPTMCILGLPFYVCAFSMFDLQARFFLELLKGSFTLPSKEKMLRENEEQMQELYSKRFQKKHAHMMGPKQGNYYKELSCLAKIKPIPPVLTKIHNLSSEKFMNDFLNFRNDIFRIIDDENFEIVN